MIRKYQHLSAVALLALALVASPAFAGGNLETVDLTAGASTFGPPFVDAPLVPIRWDARCVPISYTLDTTPPAGLDLATTQATLQAAFDSWDDLRTSFWDGDITSTAAITNPLGAFDFVNELAFQAAGQGFLAFSPSVSLLKDTTLAPGDDIDQDGDSDVFDPAVEGIHTCADVDSDGDIEFPAGDYAAGTILDNDVAFNPDFTWTVGTPDAGGTTVDLEAVAVHEFGHSHGLAHSFINQISDNDGAGATMFPFVDITDPDDQVSQRSPASDDKAWSSFNYPEGSAFSGPAALQHGDIPFGLIYGLLEGEVINGDDGLPIAGAHIFARRLFGGAIVSGGYSGSANLVAVEGALSPADPDSALFLPPTQAFGITDGAYKIPVPFGLYTVGLEALDGLPAGAGNISLTAIVGDSFGQLDFTQENYNGRREDESENRPGSASIVLGFPSFVNDGIDLTSNVTNTQTSFGAIGGIGFTGSPPGRMYAVRFPGADVLADLTAGAKLHTALFGTFVSDASVVPVYEDAMLTTGTLNGDGTAAIDITSPLRSKSPFVGQASNETPFFFNGVTGLSNQVETLLSADPTLDLFLMLELPAGPFPGPSGTAPLVGLDVAGPFGNSFISDDAGVTFNPVPFNFQFSLVSTP